MNCSSTIKSYQILVEVPEGSIPVNTTDYTRILTLVLKPFQAEKIEYYFYFPKIGLFKVYPPNISLNGIVIAVVAKSFEFNVLEKKTTFKMDSIKEVLLQGSKQDILFFLKNKNILDEKIFKMNQIYHLLNDKEFYLEVISILRQRKIFEYNIWSFSIFHGDLISLKELFHQNKIKQCFSPLIKYFKNDIITIDNINFLEYFPIINARFHLLYNNKCNILNKELRDQYKNFINYLVEKNPSQINEKNKICLVYYLLIQERIEEAIKLFKTINKEKLIEEESLELQYDYFNSYLDFYIGYPNFKEARNIYEKYLDYPIIHWRNLFYEIANQLEEHDSGKIYDNKNEEKSKNYEELEGEQISAWIDVGDKKIIVKFCNCKEIKINYYLIDLELLFSRNPFALKNNFDFDYVNPNLTQIKKVEKLNENKNLEFYLPEKFDNKNVCIQAKGGNSTIENLMHFSNTLTVDVLENQGQIKVADLNSKPLSQVNIDYIFYYFINSKKIYVKVYCLMNNGENNFYKDGYTNLIGIFDYASRQNWEISNIKKFAFFVSSEGFGKLLFKNKKF